MAFLFAQTKCACDTDIKFRLKKPTRMHHSVGKVECQGCGSRYLVSSKATQDERGRRSYKTFVDAIELTSALNKALDHE